MTEKIDPPLEISLEQWAREHSETYMRKNAQRAFGNHDQEALQYLREEYDYYLSQIDKGLFP